MLIDTDIVQTPRGNWQNLASAVTFEVIVLFNQYMFQTHDAVARNYYFCYYVISVPVRLPQHTHHQSEKVAEKGRLSTQIRYTSTLIRESSPAKYTPTLLSPLF